MIFVCFIQVITLIQRIFKENQYLIKIKWNDSKHLQVLVRYKAVYRLVINFSIKAPCIKQGAFVFLTKQILQYENKTLFSYSDSGCRIFLFSKRAGFRQENGQSSSNS
jgi:hypothetical protein